MRLKNWFGINLTCLCEESFSHKNDPSRKQEKLKKKILKLIFVALCIMLLEKRSV